MVAEMRKKKKPPPPPPSSASSSTIGILSFELANAMSRAVRLHRSLSDPEIYRLSTQILSSPSIRSLVSADDRFLLSLAVSEKLDDLNRVAAVASRLDRRRCSLPALVGFEHVYSDLLAGRIQTSIPAIFLHAVGRDLDSAVRKMERYLASTAALYAELDRTSSTRPRSFPAPTRPAARSTRRSSGRGTTSGRFASPCCGIRASTKAVLLLARAVCTIHARIRTVFGEYVFGVEASNSGISGRIVGSDGVQGSGLVASPGVNFRREGLRLHCGANSSWLFLNCLNLGSSAAASWNDSEDQLENASSIIPFSGENKNSGSGIKVNKSGFGSKSRLAMLALPSTVGGSVRVITC